MKEIYENIVYKLLEACKLYYGDRLISFCLFGSVARETMSNESDIDFLIVVKNLPVGRVERTLEFLNIERNLMQVLIEARRKGIYTGFSPVIKTPEEVQMGSLLFLDMLEDGKILFDRDDFLKKYFEKFREKLKSLGAKRVKTGDAWHWVLKSDYKPDEIFEIL